MSHPELNTDRAENDRDSLVGKFDDELSVIVKGVISDLKSLEKLRGLYNDQIWSALIAVSHDAIINIRSHYGQADIQLIDDDTKQLHRSVLFSGVKTTCPAVPEYICIYDNKMRTFISRDDLDSSIDVDSIEPQPPLDMLDN